LQQRKTKIPELCNKKLIKHNLVLSPGDEREPQKTALRENRCGFYPHILSEQEQYSFHNYDKSEIFSIPTI